jgi:Putative metallopeptidase
MISWRPLLPFFSNLQVTIMSSFKCAPRAIIAAWIGLAAGFAAAPQARSQPAPGIIGDQESVFIDGQTFTIVPGRPKPDAAPVIRDLGGRDLGPGAIIYRNGDRLYLLGAPLVLQRGQPGRPESLQVDADREELGRVRVRYDPPKNPEHQALYERLKENQVLETIQQILSPVRLPQPGLLIKTMGCDGIINSWYNRGDADDHGPTVHMCYELLENIIKLSSTDVRPNISRHDAIVGQFLFWTLHETGHAAFDIFQVPLFGREEDAADLFAAYIMLHFGHDQARRWIEGAAYTSDEFMADVPWGKNYASVHGLPQQRFYNLICLAYGADPVTFAGVTENMTNMMEQKGVLPKAQQGVLPKKRAENCEYEFQTFDHAWKTQIRPHIDLAMAQKVLDTSWFPEPMQSRVPPSPVAAAATPAPIPAAPTPPAPTPKAPTPAAPTPKAPAPPAAKSGK